MRTSRPVVVDDLTRCSGNTIDFSEHRLNLNRVRDIVLPAITLRQLRERQWVRHPSASFGRSTRALPPDSW